MTAVGALIRVKPVPLRDRLHFQTAAKAQAPGTRESGEGGEGSVDMHIQKALLHLHSKSVCTLVSKG